MFQGLRTGSLLYILDKRQAKLTIAQVMSVSNPMPRYNSTANIIGGIEQVVDVSVMTDNGQVDYKQLPAMMSVANFGNDGVVLCDTKECMMSEIESMCRASQAVLSSVPFHQSVVSRKDDMIIQLNPQMAKDKERDEEMNTLRQKVDEQAKMLSRIEQLLVSKNDEQKTRKE